MKSMYSLSLLFFTVVLVGCGGDDSEPPVNKIDSSDGGVILGNGGSEQDPDNHNDADKTPPPSDPIDDAGSVPDTGFATQMLNAVNAARSKPQNCGGTLMPAVPALSWDYDLTAAASRHSGDMANNNFFSHTGSDGSSASQRITDTGYRFYAMGENIAAGYRDIDSVMSSWMKSKGHCENIMSPRVTQMGAALVENIDTTYGKYWTQVFASPRSGRL